MKIGVNARFLAKPYTGIGLYTKELFSTIALRHPEVELVLVTPEPVILDVPPNLRIEPVPESFVGTGGMRKTYWEQVQVPRFFLKEDVDLAHFPYPSNPWRGFSKPCVVTVHDTVPWTMSEYRRSLSTRLYQDRCRLAVAKADRVLTVSRASEADIMEVCGVPPEKITVAPNALPRGFDAPIDLEKRERLLSKYGLSPKRPFFFYLGGYDERKNVEHLVKVFRSSVAPFYDVDLVLGGGKLHGDRLYRSYESLTKTRNEVTLRAQPGRVITTGFIHQEDLPALYQSCFAFVNLSRKEGFNLPLLEAAASHVPVIASDLGVHHEILGDYGKYVEVDSTDGLESVFRKLLDDSAAYQILKKKMVGFRSSYSWERTADQVYQLYLSILCS